MVFTMPSAIGQPVLAITGHTFHDLIGTRYQQDVDLDKLFMDVAPYNQRIMGPAHVNSVVDEAVRSALGKHAVSHITIPKDIQEWRASDFHRSDANIKSHSGLMFQPTAPVPARTHAGAGGGDHECWQEGRDPCRPWMPGGAREEVEGWPRLVAGPVIKPLLGKAVVPDQSPYTTGGIGLLGTAPSQDAMEECDTLLIAGSSFPYMDFYPKPGKANAFRSTSRARASGCAIRLT